MMSATTIGLAYTVTWLLFAVPTAVFLLKAYGRSKMSGFIWLLVALVVWPFFAQLARMGIPMLTAQMGYGINPVLMMNLGLSLITGILVLVAVIVLERELGQRIVAATPAAGYPGSAAAAAPPTELR